MRSQCKFFFWGLLSLFLTAFGNPGWIPWLGPIAGICGFAFFWYGLSSFTDLKKRFWISSLWYGFVQMIQLSWMSATQFQGIYILFAYLGIALWIGSLFGIMTLLVPRLGAMSIPRLLAIPSLWTLIEWGRMNLLCGFSWNPSGMALAGDAYSVHFASIWGVLGLSFIFVLVNLLCFEALCSKTFKKGFVTLSFAGIPYLFGIIHLGYHQKKSLESSQELSVALVQTGLLPPEKAPLKGMLSFFISPLEQWRRIVSFLKENPNPLNMIVLPENVIPFSKSQYFYSIEAAGKVLKAELGDGIVDCFPPLIPPFAKEKLVEGKVVWAVSNAFFAQTLSNYFKSELIVGFDDQDKVLKECYQAAFHFVPDAVDAQRYEKRVLVPLAEYVPFDWCKEFTKHYNIKEFFTHGKKAKVFNGRIPFSVSICYEETYPDIMREGRLKGADLYINVTNDNWFYPSRLPLQHLEHARLRSVENGVTLLRSCNVGVSAAIDSLGKVVKKTESTGGIFLNLKNYSYSTLFTHWGDAGIVCLCFGILGVFFRLKKIYSW